MIEEHGPNGGISKKDSDLIFVENNKNMFRRVKTAAGPWLVESKQTALKKLETKTIEKTQTLTDCAKSGIWTSAFNN